MAKSGGIEDDLQYVRTVLHESEKTGSPAANYYLWAVLCFTGFSLIDWKPESVGPYWAIAGPLGGVASWILGWRAGRALGQSSGREGVRHTLHWVGMMAAILLVIPLQITGLVSMKAVPSLILLLVASSYYTAGIYLDRRMRFIGILMAACYLATIFVKDWPWIWTCTGGMLALSLVVSGLLARASSRALPSGERP